MTFPKTCLSCFVFQKCLDTCIYHIYIENHRHSSYLLICLPPLPQKKTKTNQRTIQAMVLNLPFSMPSGWSQANPQLRAPEKSVVAIFPTPKLWKTNMIQYVCTVMYMYKYDCTDQIILSFNVYMMYADMYIHIMAGLVWREKHLKLCVCSKKELS